MLSMNQIKRNFQELMDHQNLFTQVLLTEARALDRAAQSFKKETAEQLVSLFALLSGTGGSLIISGVGKSGLIAQKIAATFSSLGLPSFFLHPTEAMHGDLGRVTKSDAIVLISKSGTTEELLALIPFLSVPRERIIALVGNVNSPIAQKSGIILDASVEKEACLNDLAPTTSTTVALALGDAMAVLYENVQGVSKEKFAINHPAGLLGKTLTLTVEKLMISAGDCPIVEETATLQDAILAMTQKPVGMCAVISGEKMKGLLVEGDIRRAFAKFPDAITRKITEFMNARPTTILPSTLAFDALKVMEDTQRPLNVVPIVEGDQFRGVLRLHDLFKAGFTTSK
jgi:arabinose-5-phosphate isomerase